MDQIFIPLPRQNIVLCILACRTELRLGGQLFCLLTDISQQVHPSRSTSAFCVDASLYLDLSVNGIAMYISEVLGTYYLSIYSANWAGSSCPGTGSTVAMQQKGKVVQQQISVALQQTVACLKR